MAEWKFGLDEDEENEEEDDSFVPVCILASSQFYVKLNAIFSVALDFKMNFI
jgi:hypothetical protein